MTDSERRFTDVDREVQRRIGRKLPDTEQGRRALRLALAHLAPLTEGRRRALEYSFGRADWCKPSEALKLIDAALREPRTWTDNEIVHELRADEMPAPTADASEIEPTAKRRLADDYAAALQRGEPGKGAPPKTANRREPPNLRSRKRFLKEGVVPEGAMSWDDSKEKGRRLYEWLRAVFAHFPGEGRVAKVAAILQNLFNFDQRRGGYAFVSNAGLAELATVPIDKVELTMTKLAEAGFIIRTHTFTRTGEPERHTWPALPKSGEPAKTAGWKTIDQPAKTAGSERSEYPADTAGGATRQNGRKLPAKTAGGISGD